MLAVDSARAKSRSQLDDGGNCSSPWPANAKCCGHGAQSLGRSAACCAVGCRLYRSIELPSDQRSISQHNGHTQRPSLTTMPLLLRQALHPRRPNLHVAQPSRSSGSGGSAKSMLLRLPRGTGWAGCESAGGAASGQAEAGRFIAFALPFALLFALAFALPFRPSSLHQDASTRRGTWFQIACRSTVAF